MNFMTFHSVGNVIIPTDELIFFRGVGIPPTRNIYMQLVDINHLLSTMNGYQHTLTTSQIEMWPLYTQQSMGYRGNKKQWKIWVTS